MKGSRLSIPLLVLALLSGPGCASVNLAKRIKQPIHTDYSVREVGFASSINHLVGAALVEGNSVVQLVNGDEIFPAMLEAIHGAQHTITLESYIWSRGEVSRQFAEALSERATNGVKVHVIVDSVGSLKLGGADVRQMLRSGVQLVRYNPPIPFKFFRVNHRTHRKILVVDGRIGFTGGVCLADEWMGNAEPPRWRETHFRVDGPVVGQMQAAFMDNWLQMRGEVLHGTNYFPDVKPVGSMLAQYFKSGPQDGVEHAQLTFLLSIAAARKNIRIAHSYFVPNQLLVDGLLEARRRGVKIEIIVPRKVDNVAVAMASRSRYGELLAAGIEFHEYQPTLYHCKIMIVDDCWTTAGSVNFDDRSFRINDEANINVLDPDFAASLIASFEEDKARSRPLTVRDLKRRNIVLRGFDRFAGLFKSQL